MAKRTKDFWRSRRGALIIALVSLILAYLMASRAIDTGSLQQYGLMLALLIVTVNRLIFAVHPHKKAA